MPEVPENEATPGWATGGGQEVSLEALGEADSHSTAPSPGVRLLAEATGCGADDLEGKIGWAIPPHTWTNVADAALHTIPREAMREVVGGTSATPDVGEVWTTEDLLATDFPPVKFIVSNLLAPGLTILAGKPKCGKSWAALNVVVVREFMGRDANVSEPLYLALEDSPRRLRSRLEVLARAGVELSPAHFVNSWPTMEQGAVEALEGWLNEHPESNLVVIDTLARLRGSHGVGEYNYQADAMLLEPLQRLAQDREVAIVVVHHTRKSKAEDGDPLDTVSGTLGLNGMADTVLVLTKTQLQGRGRDLEDDVELSVQLEGGLWVPSGLKLRVWQWVRGMGDEVVTNQDAYRQFSGESKEAVQKVLQRMQRAGELERVRNGVYRLPAALRALSAAG